MPPTNRTLALKTTLLDVAERIIADDGLASLRARDLAQQAGCAVGAIYTVFPDLDTIVLEVNLRTLAIFEGCIDGLQLRDPGREGPDAATAQLVALGAAYIAFASDHPKRWRALFQHRMSDNRPAPDWYVGQQVRLFAHIEGPLGVLRPDLSGPDRHLLARTLFSAAHGVVSLGLDQKLLTLPAEVLADQVATLLRAAATGLAHDRPAG